MALCESKEKRGRFILFEGCDGVGKTTQLRMVFNSFCTKGVNLNQIAFPFRTAAYTGKCIDDFLTKKQPMSREWITIMFSANRWEMKDDIEATLKEGHDVFVDRYAYSGMAYAIANGLSAEWACGLDKGLPKPDVVFYLTRDKPDLDGKPAEIYDDLSFQQKVKHAFETQLFDESFWIQVDTTEKTPHETFLEILHHLDKIDVQNKEIGRIYLLEGGA